MFKYLKTILAEIFSSKIVHHGAGFREVVGDLTEDYHEYDCDIIVQGCNCQGVNGAGISGAFNYKFNADDMDRWYRKDKKNEDVLGTYNSWFHFDNSLEFIRIVNAYTQFYPGADFRHEALSRILDEMNKEFKGETIGFPLIGCGIAGGKWHEVRRLIKTKLTNCNVVIFYFTEEDYKTYVNEI